MVGPEAANNGASAGSMVPLLTLGIPGSSATAVLLGGFLIWGLTPGPLLMEQDPEFAWGLIGSMYLGNVMLLVHQHLLRARRSPASPVSRSGSSGRS